MENLATIISAVAASAAVLVSGSSIFLQLNWRKSDNLDERFKEVHDDIKRLDDKFDRKFDSLTTVLIKNPQQ